MNTKILREHMDIISTSLKEDDDLDIKALDIKARNLANLLWKSNEVAMFLHHINYTYKPDDFDSPERYASEFMDNDAWRFNRKCLNGWLNYWVRNIAETYERHEDLSDVINEIEDFRVESSSTLLNLANHVTNVAKEAINSGKIEAIDISELTDDVPGMIKVHKLWARVNKSNR